MKRIFLAIILIVSFVFCSCTAKPKVKNNDNYGAVTAAKGVGGIVALFNVAGTYTIENCHNYTTALMGNEQVGGVIGRVGDYVIILTVKNCSSNGSFAEADVIGSKGAKANITLTGGNA